MAKRFTADEQSQARLPAAEGKRLQDIAKVIAGGSAPALVDS